MTSGTALNIPAQAPRERPRVVLVVDDEPSMQTVLSRMLRLHGFDVHLANCSADAIALATIYRLDAAILDLGLKGQRSGLDVLAWFRSQSTYAALPVLIFTGQVDLCEEVQEAIKTHRAHVFHKPQPFSVLIDHLKQLFTSVPAEQESAA